jgi:hypothetical protein
MTAVSSKYGWLVVPAYPACGLVLGLADPFLGQLAQQAGTRPGVATAVSVNLLLPLAAVALGLACPRLTGVWLGAAAMTLGFLAGLAVRYPGGIPDWSLAGILGAVPPVLVAAALGYGVLGTVAALFVWARRRAASSPSRTAD